MDQLTDFFSGLFSTDWWPARWSCGKWTSFHGWLYIISSILIASAYFLIPASLVKFTRRREDLPFTSVFWLFILFILACGTTHLVDAIIFWFPFYRFSALLLFVTAIISWIAVIALRRILPQAIDLKSPAQLEKIIEKRTNQLQQSNLSLKRINEDLDTYVYAASHDLKSPINNMEGLVLVLREEIEAGRIPPDILVGKLEESVKRVQNTISRLTDVVKLQKSPYDDVQEIDPKQIFNEVLDEIEMLLKTSQAEVVFNSQLDTLFYSVSGLRSILYNLITNAIKYRKPDIPCHVEVSFLLKEDISCLEVRDNGLGIDLERYNNRMFGLFKRFHSHIEGSGIGLYSIKQLITRKGGKISVSSTPGEGSVFTVFF